MAAFTPAYGYYDVTASPYNAVGNGTTDDTTAIQAAITACTATGGAVFFPPGSYLISSTLAITGSNVSLMGSSAGGCTILLAASAGTTTPMVTLSAANDNIIITDLTFQGNNKNNGAGASPGADAITFGSSGGGINHYCKVLRCNFTQTPGSTIHFWNTTDGEVTDCHFFDVGFNNGNNSDSFVTPAVFLEASLC